MNNQNPTEVARLYDYIKRCKIFISSKDVKTRCVKIIILPPIPKYYVKNYLLKFSKITRSNVANVTRLSILKPTIN